MTEKAFHHRLQANVFLMLLGFLVSSAHASEVIKSASDDRHYRYLELPNHLQVLLFPIPPVVQLYRKKPVHYLSNLLGHEGEGSLLLVLKGQGSNGSRCAELEPPCEQLIDAMPTLLFSPWWFRQRRIDSLSGFTLEDLNRFAKSVFVDGRAELLLYGNLTRSKAAKLAGLVEVELLSAMAGKVLPPAKVVKLEPANLEEPAPIFVKPVNHNDNAAILYLQGRNDSLQESARALLLRQVLRTPFFHQLRTEQQLGYAVFMSPMPFKDVPGTVLVVQSPVASTHALVSAMGKFVAEGTELVPEDLAQDKSAVATQPLESPENLHEQVSRYWESILRDRRERLAKAVRAIQGSHLAECKRPQR